MAARPSAALFSLAFAAAVLASGGAAADPHQVKQGDITVSSRMVRTSFGGAPNSAAYMVISNSGAVPDKLLSARCACAISVGIHATQNMAGISTMQPVGPIVIPPHGQVVFHPGGLHLMLTQLKEPLVEGGVQEITLVFQRAGTLRASFHIRAQIPAGSSPPVRH
ncbi:MAG TPA: copper chaperone PCu(A)C [Caulobacteraceae bacterium]|nr:copper chaperone PCu(A)C [Caulobacteraceae bacterium]